MKGKLACVIFLLAIAIFMSACSSKISITETPSIQVTQMNPVDIDQIWLDSLNEDLGTDYESFEQALNEQIAIYEADNNNENLYKVCRALSEMPRVNYVDMIVKYYGEFFDNIASDHEYYLYVNNNWDELFCGSISIFIGNYLYALYENDLKERFQYILSNLDLYIEDPNQIIKTVAGCVFELTYEMDQQGTPEDYRLLMDILLQCEQQYFNEVTVGSQVIIYSNIAVCAEELGDTELAEAYTQKKDELLSTVVDN